MLAGEERCRRANLERIVSWLVAKVAKTFGKSPPAETLGEFRYPKTPSEPQDR